MANKTGEDSAFTIAEQTALAIGHLKSERNLPEEVIHQLWNLNLNPVSAHRERGATRHAVWHHILQARRNMHWGNPIQDMFDPRQKDIILPLVRSVTNHLTEDTASMEPFKKAALLLRNTEWNEADWQLAIRCATPEDRPIVRKLHETMSEHDLRIQTYIALEDAVHPNVNEVDSVQAVFVRNGLDCDRNAAWEMAQELLALRAAMSGANNWHGL